MFGEGPTQKVIELMLQESCNHESCGATNMTCVPYDYYWSRSIPSYLHCLGCICHWTSADVEGNANPCGTILKDRHVAKHISSDETEYRTIDLLTIPGSFRMASHRPENRLAEIPNAPR